MEALKEIPIKIAKEISEKYGYNQVVILAQKDVNKDGIINGWATTYNTNKKDCKHLGDVARIQSRNLRCYYQNYEVVTSTLDILDKEKNND